MVLQCDLIRVATPFFMTSLLSNQFVVVFVFLSDVMVCFCTKQSVVSTCLIGGTAKQCEWSSRFRASHLALSDSRLLLLGDKVAP